MPPHSVGPNAPEAPAPLRTAEAEFARRTPKSRELWEAARHWVPLGVHSNYRYVDPYPFYVARAQGVQLTDADGNQYLDFNMAFGALQSGHAHPRLVRALRDQIEHGTVYGYEWADAPAVAELVCRRYFAEHLRFSSTGLEATQHAVRLARAATGRRIIVKFEGSYHGSHDGLLVGVKPTAEAAGPARAPRSVPAGPGILEETVGRTVVAPFNDLDAVREIVRAHRNDVAAIIAEPIPMNMGFVPPVPGFLAGLRELADEVGALLIFDEIKTGAKFLHGAAHKMGVRPDLFTLGKSIACGVPLSVLAGRADLLERIGPRRVAHAGTYNSNPLALTACRTSLTEVLTPDAMERSTELCRRLSEGYRSVLSEAGVTAQVAYDGVSGTVSFAERPVRDWRSFLEVDGNRSMLYYYLCLNRGLIPSGTGPDEQWTVSVQHSAEDVETHLALLREVASGLMGGPIAGGIEESV